MQLFRDFELQKLQCGLGSILAGYDDDDVARSLTHSHSLVVVCGDRRDFLQRVWLRQRYRVLGGAEDQQCRKMVALVLMVNKGLVDQSRSRGWLFWV